MAEHRPPAVVRGTRHLVLLVVRVVLGLIMIGRGWRRWQSDGLDRQIGFLNRYQVPWSEYAAWGAIVLELVGGLFLIVGALTPLVAAAFVVEQVLIIAWRKWWQGPWLNDPSGDGFEYTAITACLALVLMVFGAGRVAVDGLFGRRRRERDRIGAYDEYEPA